MPAPCPPNGYAPEPDPELRRRFHEGRPEAMEELARLFYGDARRYALALLRDEDKAQEAIQDTFLRLVERHQLFQPERPFRPWFFAVCRNCCLAQLRRNAQGIQVIDLAGGEVDAAEMAADTPRAWESMIRREHEARALSLLGELPEIAKTIVILHLFEELTFREIADITALPAATAATLYYRTLTDMRRQLTGDAEARKGTSHVG